jgi:hypothetical protein
VPSLNTVWLKLAQLTPNTEAWRQDHKHLQKIDELQHTKAHQHWRHYGETKTNAAKTEDCYDLFIRPMEQIFACDRPMSSNLLEATKDSIKLVWLTRQIAHIAGIEQWVSTTFHPLIELSRIRHLNTAQIAEKFDSQCNPYQRLPPMMFNSIHPPRPFCTNANDLTPKVEDFNLGGRLHGLYVAPNIKMPQFIIRRFTNREISEEETKRFHQSVIVTRLQWFTDTNIQMMIQKGLKPPSEKTEMPNWIDRLQTETISNNSAIMTKTITEKIAQLHLTIEDFLEGGRLAYYPNEGVTFLSDNMIKNLGMSNLTTKESKTLLSHINKTMREMRKTITSARRAQEDRLVKMEKHVQNMKKKTESKLREPRKLSLSKTKSATKNLTQKFESMVTRQKTSTRTSSSSPPFARRETQTPSPTLSSWDPPPRPKKQKPRRQELSSCDEDDFEEQPPIKKERGRNYTKDDTSIKRKPQVKWGQKEESRNVKAPPRSHSASSLTKRGHFEPAKVFENKEFSKHPYIWNGDVTHAPDWAKVPNNATDIGTIKSNLIPSHQKTRTIINTNYRAYPCDGVNQVQDVIIARNKNERLTIAISSVTKERQRPASETKTRTINISSKDWSAFEESMKEAANSTLPPAIKDPNSLEPVLKVIHHKGARFNYTITIKHTPGLHGHERMLHIRQSEDKSNLNNSIEFPWRFTKLFRHKFYHVKQEIENKFDSQE